MEGSPPQGGGGGSSPAPFLVKTYDMVEDPATDDVVSWGPSNASFVVWNPPDFSRDLLPKYFKHNNFSSFIRQLNTYGFRKIDPERWEFANEGFIRGQTDLLKNIHRRKPVHSHSLQNQGNVPLAESERRELEEEIDRLKYEKTVLLEDLQRHTQQQYGLNWHIRSLEERLRVMEERQTNLIASLGQILQSHGFVSSFLWEPDHFSKKRRVPKVDFFDGDTAIKEHQIEHSQSIFPMHPTNTEPPDRMELSLVSLEQLFQAANHASGEDMYHGATASRHPSMVLTDLQSPASLHLSSQRVGDIHSSSELADSPSYMDSPELPLAEIDEEDTCKAAEADVSSHAATSDTSQDGTVDTRASDEPTRVNDLFWERFLTDTQQSGDTCGAQSDKQDGEVKAETTEEKMERSIGVQGSRFFHNRNNVDQIIEKMGHLTPAENA